MGIVNCIAEPPGIADGGRGRELDPARRRNAVRPRLTSRRLFTSVGAIMNFVFTLMRQKLIHAGDFYQPFQP
jgi:hypothetical protein